MELYQDTVTLFNRRREPAGDVWYPTVLKGVRLIADRGTLASCRGSESQDRALLLIPYEERGGAVTVAGKTWLPPGKWQEAPAPEQAVTFAWGEMFDFFMDGVWEEGPARDEDYPGGFYHSMNRALDGVFALSGAARFRALPHFEVTGR